jgi:hypothetical protein
VVVDSFRFLVIGNWEPETCYHCITKLLSLVFLIYIMRLSLLLLFFSLAFLHSYSQKKLTMYKTFGGAVYEMDTLTLSTKQVMMVLKQNPEAFAEFKVARRRATASSVLGFTGGLLVALPLVTAVAGGQPEWIYAGVGGVFLLATIPLSVSFRGHALNALDIYNSNLHTSKARVKSSFYFYGTGASLVLRF